MEEEEEEDSAWVDFWWGWLGNCCGGGAGVGVGAAAVCGGGAGVGIVEEKGRAGGLGVVGLKVVSVHWRKKPQKKSGRGCVLSFGWWVFMVEV